MKPSLKLINAVIVTFTLISAPVSATNITVGGSSVSITDTGVHATKGTVADQFGLGDAQGGTNYEIQNMEVTWSDSDQITVDIFTNFGHFNNDHNYGPKDNNIIFGDLFIGVDGDQGKSDFVFSLGDLIENNSPLADFYEGNYQSNYARYYDFNTGSREDQWQSVGGLYQRDNSQDVTVQDYHGKNKNGVVFSRATGQELTNANTQWKIDNRSYSNHGEFDILTFTFNVSGVSAFQSASQLSLAWAMSCFNDEIKSTLNVSRAPGQAVSEPSAVALFGLALAGLAYRRKQSS